MPLPCPLLSDSVSIEMDTQDNQLCFSGVKAQELVEKYGSPLYVYEESIIRKQYRELVDQFLYPKFRVHYAVKANYNPTILKILLEEGCGADTVSDQEVRLCLDLGFPPESIIFTGDNNTDEEMRYCLEKDVLINVGSLSQLERLGKLKEGARVSVRINPDVGAGHHSHCITGGPKTKFGIYHDKIEQIQAIVKQYNLKLVGIHSHIGTGIMDSEKFIEAMDVTTGVAKKIEGLEFVDFGGGIGIPYRESQSPLNLKDFGAKVSEHFTKFCAEYGNDLELKIEPGRFLVCQAGTLIAQVNTLKETPAHQFAGCNTGFNHLMRPMAYGSYHKILNASRVEGEKKAIVLCGNICESGDVFTQGSDGIEDREVSALEEGDLVAILDAGAYGMSMSMQYNMRSRPPEVLVSPEGQTKLIRKKESYEDIMSNFC
ncbi:MAG: diaminopimelate decarboxylase [Planctomycetes bacterium]|nr:diaminopimelate decarboxylase [Planctomycetota bacterium]